MVLPLVHAVIFPSLDLFPKLLRQDINPILQLQFGLLVAKELWELRAEPVVALAELIDLPLHLTSSAQVIDERPLHVIQTLEDVDPEIPHHVELLNSFSIIQTQHLFPLRLLLTFCDLRHSFKKLALGEAP